MKEANFMGQSNVAPIDFNLDANILKKSLRLNNDKDTAKKTVIPCRIAPKWEANTEVSLSAKKAFVKMALGQAPIGIVPPDVLISNEKERLDILQGLQSVSAAKYDNTGAEQRVESWGKPLVDSKSLKEHLSMKVNKTILSLSNPLVFKIKKYLENLGFKVGFLTDPLTGLDYHAGVFRLISVAKEKSVLHVDDFIRDGSMKADFRVPFVLKNRPYYQVSFNILLDDGGYQADPLYTYNRFYNSCDEKHCMANRWQFPVELMGSSKVFKYQPTVGETYVFSTTAYHDIYGGSPLANRVTWSVFGIYIPSLDSVVLYN